MTRFLNPPIAIRWRDLGRSALRSSCSLPPEMLAAGKGLCIAESGCLRSAAIGEIDRGIHGLGNRTGILGSPLSRLRSGRGAERPHDRAGSDGVRSPLETDG